MPSKQTLLDQLAADIRVKNVCPELAAQAQNLVMGEGSVDADIFFVGEAPGKKEDETGLPFVGAAGKILDELLLQGNIAREDVYITSVVKYRPPKNRDPKPEEKAAFMPYLLKQIEIIQPKIIAPLGRHGMEYFLPGMKIGEVHGEPKRIQLGDHSVVIMPLFHPAAALYNRSLRQTLSEDFLKLPEILKQVDTLQK